MEETMTTIEELYEKLNYNTTEEDLVELGISEETASLILCAYKKGNKEYSDKYYQLKFKYDALCISVCERLLLNEHA